jgi:hypothetical protein
MLKFSDENSKTKKLRKVRGLQNYLRNRRKIYSMDLLSGWSCPGARDCMSRVIIENGKRRIKDGKHTQFRCFSASQEVVYPALYDNRKHNFDSLRACKSVKQMVELLESSMPPNLGILRWHVGGGFFNRRYFQAASAVARNHPDKLFYAYLKNLPVLEQEVLADPSQGVYLDNFLLTASRGGKYDHLIEPLNLREAVVVNYECDATMEIDNDDSHAATVGGSFNLLIHGTQPAGTPASLAVTAQRKRG